MDEKEEESVTITMTVSEDRKGFVVKLDSTMEMTDQDIIIAIECWCSDSLLGGYSFGDISH